MNKCYWVLGLSQSRTVTAVRCLRTLEILVVKLLLCLLVDGWVNAR